MSAPIVGQKRRETLIQISAATPTLGDDGRPIARDIRCGFAKFGGAHAPIGGQRRSILDLGPGAGLIEIGVVEAGQFHQPFHVFDDHVMRLDRDQILLA
jgi:hypothetical protein